MYVGLLMSTTGRLYVSLFGGLSLIVLFLVWAIAFIRTITGGKENTNLQKMYGQENEKVADANKKTKIALLAVVGILLVGLGAAYYIYL